MIPYLFLLVAGIIILFVMLRNRAKNRRLIKGGYRSEGIIVDAKPATGKNKNGKHAVVKFVTATEETLILESSENYLAGKVKKGKKVMVWYDPIKPEDFIIVWPEDKITFIMAIVFGILFILGGIFFLLNYLEILTLYKMKH
jgi:preprotein translocase subunit SecE